MDSLYRVINKKTGHIVSVYDTRTDKNGFPHFLIYEDNQWKYRSAKHYVPMYLIGSFYDRDGGTLSSKEALSDVTPIGWSEDVLNGDKKVVVTKTKQTDRMCCEICGKKLHSGFQIHRYAGMPLCEKCYKKRSGRE